MQNTFLLPLHKSYSSMNLGLYSSHHFCYNTSLQLSVIEIPSLAVWVYLLHYWGTHMPIHSQLYNLKFQNVYWLWKLGSYIFEEFLVIMLEQLTISIVHLRHIIISYFFFNFCPSKPILYVKSSNLLRCYRLLHGSLDDAQHTRVRVDSYCHHEGLRNSQLSRRFLIVDISQVAVLVLNGGAMIGISVTALMDINVMLVQVAAINSRCRCQCRCCCCCC